MSLDCLTNGKNIILVGSDLRFNFSKILNISSHFVIRQVHVSAIYGINLNLPTGAYSTFSHAQFYQEIGFALNACMIASYQTMALQKR